MHRLAGWILKLLGWDINNKPEGVKKAVVVMGPHTSNFDFVIGKLAFMRYGVPSTFLIKSELFFPPLGWLLKALGGVPVYRRKNNHFTDQAAKYFVDNESMFMVFTPEGTRSYNEKWKKGFYYIAQKANVPIYIGFMDYKTKKGGFHGLFHPTGDIEKDIAYLKNELSQYSGKRPKQGIRSVADEKIKENKVGV